MFRINGTIDEMLAKFSSNGWKIVERLGGKGNRDERVILQDTHCKLGLFSLMTGKDIDGNLQTVMMFERKIDAQGKLF